MTVPELLKEVPGLARFYREPTVVDLHAGGGGGGKRAPPVTRTTPVHRDEPESLRMLDPFARSLVLRGITEAPCPTQQVVEGGRGGGRYRSALARGSRMPCGKRAKSFAC